MKEEEKYRYSRQILLEEIGTEGQEKLKAARVLVIGAGGLGAPVLQYLCSSGLGTIGIVDGDQVDLSNLPRQLLFGTDDIGKNKAEVATVKLKALNEYCNAKFYPFMLNRDNIAEIFADYSIILDCTDNFETRYLINDYCIQMDKVMVFGSIHKFEGQLSVFNYKGGPGYRCLFPMEEEQLRIPNCVELGVLPVLPGIIGMLQANETLKIILHKGEVLSGKLLVYNALKNTTMISYFKRNLEEYAKALRHTQKA